MCIQMWSISYCDLDPECVTIIHITQLKETCFSLTNTTLILINRQSELGNENNRYC